MTKLKFFGGVNEIGGNKILLEDRNTKVLFDFGQSFSFGADYFTGWLGPRAINGLGDYFAFNLLPKISGLYSKEMLATTDLPYRKPKIDAVFLSHAHFDHMTHIQFLDPGIPIHVGVGTKLLMDSMEETSSFCKYGEHECHKFRTGQEITIDNVTIEPIHVDHSIPAAYGFIIHTSEGAVAYTGDLRMHGPRKDLTEDFLMEAQDHEPIALICEGTRMVDVEKRKNYSEAQVRQMANDVVSSTSEIVFAMRYSRDLDRFRSFYEVARQNGRQVVISPKTAYLLSKLQDDAHLHLPDPVRDSSIQVYYKRKKSGTFDDKDYHLWERPFMTKMVTHDDVHKRQRELVMDLDFYQFTELIDIKSHPASHISLMKPTSFIPTYW